MIDGTTATKWVARARTWDGTNDTTAIPDELSELLPRNATAPELSVITPCHNDGRFLIDAIASVRALQHDGLEMIIIDDHSTDPFTRTLLGELTERGMRVVASVGSGSANARNTALAHVQADTVLPLDADNMIRAELIELGLPLLFGASDIASVHSDAQRFGVESGHWPVASPTVAELLCGNQFDMCALIRTEALQQVGGWNANISASDDWGLWVALMNAGWRHETLPKIGFDYRMRFGSLRSTLTAQTRASHLSYLVRTYPEIYAEHVIGVVDLLAGGFMPHSAFEYGGNETTSEGRAAIDRIAQLVQLCNESDAAAATAYRRMAEAERRANRKRVQLNARVEELETQIQAETAQVHDLTERATRAEEHLEALQETKLVRYAQKPRAIYGRLRGK